MGHNRRVQLEIINVMGNIRYCHKTSRDHYHGDTYHFITQSKQGTLMENGEEKL